MERLSIIISPAKKMRTDTDSFPVESEPHFLEEAERLRDRLRAMSYGELKALWKCSDAIAAENGKRLERMELRSSLTPALLAYDGIQYRYMAPNVMEYGELTYLREHLRILSGFYGLLRPFDGVTPYRLEMQAKLAVDGHADLYSFWGARLAEKLAECGRPVVNLASREYSRAVEPHLPPEVRFLTCSFGEERDGKVLERGTQCKMARGRMVRWMAENRIIDPEDLREFRELGYRYSPERSGELRFLFVREAEPGRRRV